MIFVGTKIPMPSLAAIRVSTGVPIISSAIDPNNTSWIVLSLCCSGGGTGSVAIIERRYLHNIFRYVKCMELRGTKAIIYMGE